MKKIQMGQDRNLFYNYWHILVGDRTKKYHPEMPDWRVLGCTCQGLCLHWICMTFIHEPHFGWKVLFYSIYIYIINAT